MVLLALGALCQIALKYAGLDTGPFDFSPHAFAAAAASAWLWIAVACYVGEFLAWMVILRHSSLSSAFPTGAIVLIVLMIASRWLFDEPLGWLETRRLGDDCRRRPAARAGPSCGNACRDRARRRLERGRCEQRSDQTGNTFPRDRFMSSVQDTIFDIIAKESGIDRAKITPDATLKDLEIQSLDAVQILFEIEDHFKITMPDRDPELRHGIREGSDRNGREARRRTSARNRTAA